MMRLAPLLPLLLLAACKHDKDSTPNESQPPVDDSAVDSQNTQDSDSTKDTDTALPCTASVLTVSPETGTTEFYYREPLVVSFDGDGSAAVLSLTDASGTDIPFSRTWADGNVQVQLDVILSADTTYTLNAQVCESTLSTAFTTSHLGAPLQMDPGSLVGTTWEFRLSDDATITEPVFLEPLAATYVTTPLLIGVTAADATMIDLLGALGIYNQSNGTYSQSNEVPWDFPPADFTQSPFFAATAPLVTLSYNGIDIPIEQFHLEGTIADDASFIGEGKAWGYLDTRYAGVWVARPDDPAAVCDVASSAGVSCVPCLDSEPYCMFIRAEEVHATRVGVVLLP